MCLEGVKIIKLHNQIGVYITPTKGHEGVIKINFSKWGILQNIKCCERLRNHSDVSAHRNVVSCGRGLDMKYLPRWVNVSKLILLFTNTNITLKRK